MYHPRQMTADTLQKMLAYAWTTFYQDEPQTVKMFKLFHKVVDREMANNTFRPRNRALANRAFGRDL